MARLRLIPAQLQVIFLVIRPQHLHDKHEHYCQDEGDDSQTD